MIFEKIIIQNLFSYYGEQKFEYLTTSPEKPVVLISGRNGYGKTSFINSVKLLFLGTSKEMLADVQVDRAVRPLGYLLGIDHAWQGVFNRDARENGETEYGISIVWREEKGLVTAKRFWHFNGADPIPHLHIETDFSEEGLGENGLIVDSEEAEEFLQRRLPREIVSFFFYDGEKIQALAEANEQGRMKQIEKLIGLAAVDTLDEYLKNAVFEWKKDGTKEREQAELDTLKATNSATLASKAKAEAEQDDIDAEIENIGREIRKHERYIQNTRNLAEQNNAPHLKEKFDNAKSQYEILCDKIGSTLPSTAPMWAVPHLINAVASKLDNVTGNLSQQFADDMQTVFDALPKRLFDEPAHPVPVLTVSQKNHYKTKLSAILKQYTEPSTGGFYSLSSRETAELQRKMNYFSQARQERIRHVDDLREAGRLYREWQAAKSQMESLDELSPEQKKIFKQRQDELKSLKSTRDQLLVNRGAIGEKISGFDTELVRIRDQISQQETKRVKAGINSELIARAEQARRVFDLYSHRLKAQRREEIEAALNRCFSILMSSHKLIAKIELSDSFALRYLDSNGNDIGLANVSAGMKQLAAQALLWALSEASGRAIPIVVDTPLARIDREHQSNLILNYYPNAGRQVFILPTNAELDKEKYLMIKPQTATEFRLSNSEGDRTTVARDVEMYSTENL